MTGLILVGLLPFAALGILIGQLVTTDSVGPVMGGGVSILALLGGGGSRSPARSCTPSGRSCRPGG